MLRRILGSFVVAAFLWQLWPTRFAAASSPPSLAIGEVAWAGSPLSNADEWIELWNLSDASVSLEGFWLEGAGPEEGILFDATHAIEARSAFLIANYNADHENAAHAVTPDLAATALSLSNSSLHVKLMSPNGQLIDEAGNGDAPPAGSSTPKASMVRVMPITDGAMAESWTTADASENFYAGIESYGTPGVCDGCAHETPAEELPSDPEEETEPSHEPNTEDTADPSTETGTETEVETGDEASEAEMELEESSSHDESTTELDETAVQEASVAPPSPQYPTIRLQISGDFTASETIVFDASSSTDPNGDIIYFTWNFGDGASTTGSRTAHAYQETGEYPFELVVSDMTFRSYATATLAIAPAPLPPPEVFLNEIHPAPLEGPEWIELVGVIEENLPGLVGFMIEDASGVVFRFTSSTLEEIQIHDAYALVELSSAKLNNSGDSVLLYRPDGSLADGVIYENTKKGQSWIRFPDASGGWRDGEPTPLDENSFIETSLVQPAPDLSVMNDDVKLSSQASATVQKAAGPAVGETSAAPTDSSPSKVAASIPAKPSAKISISKNSSAPPKTVTRKTPSIATAKKTASASTASEEGDLETTIEQIMTIPPNTRVALSGVVGSKTGMIGKHQFVLLAPNGRGIHVTASNKQPSPEFGTLVKIVGTLMHNDGGLYIRMGTKDAWEALEGNGLVKIRESDLENIGVEDAWSLIQVTGYVVETTQTKALIDTGTELVEIQFKKMSNYRANRLKPQDKVRVTGLLDSRETDLKLLPRDAAEVEILEHAALDQADEQSTPGIPGWMPFGAAGLTVAVTEGVKRLRKWQYEQKVQKLIEKAKE
jgi:hypothetical protein